MSNNFFLPHTAYANELAKLLTHFSNDRNESIILNIIKKIVIPYIIITKKKKTIYGTESYVFHILV